MDRAELFDSLGQALLNPEDIVYVERRGAQYSWHRVIPGAVPPTSSAGADVWMYFSGDWPKNDSERRETFCEDMLAEMESMAGGDDRCRWPLDQPWPQMH